MKKRFFKQLLSVVLCAALLFSCLPFTAFAESADTVVQMVEGDVIAGFVAEGTACTSSDPSIAWVDENGSLNAMKVGTTVISDGTTDYTVTVGDYEDGSEVVGNLKILARYNDSMQFYDGHVYLLFTSYQDGVTVTVPDLYAAYEIRDQYYEDIAEDIANGSNHTGNNAYEYFNECYDVDSLTLNRGEIVTIGMYRGFDLSVPQAALGSIQNSSLWKGLTSAVKASITTIILDYLNRGKLSSDEALARLKTVIEQEDLDYTKLLDGVVDGGVCFNRELYNQKLEWDQYENVTYELDITRNQLDMMMLYLGGNNGKFSIIKNSCATVALRGWNAAVGMRDGQPTSYFLTSEAEGIYSFVDAPKGVRDNIVKRLPGYYLNNAERVAEPNAGYQDETGWVYVSAPEYVTPLVTVYDDTTITLDTIATDISDLISAAKGDQPISYNKDDQVINVSVNYEKDGEWTTISGVDFDINGTKLSLTNENMPEDGVNFTYPYDDPPKGEYFYLIGPDGEDVSGYHDAGYLCVHTDSFPITYKVASAPYEDEVPGIGVFISGVYDTDITAEVYYKNGDERVDIDNDGINYLDEGTKVFIKSCIPGDDDTHVLNSIIFNEEEIMNGDCYDSEENAYFVIVPDELVWLTVYYEEADISLKGEESVQIQVGDTIHIADYIKLAVGWDESESDNIVWEPLTSTDEDCIEYDERSLTGIKAGDVVLFAYAAENPNICILLEVEIHDSFEDMSVITLSGDTDDYMVSYTLPDDDAFYFVHFSGYRVDKGAVMTVTPIQKDSKALRSVKFNGKTAKLGETFTVSKDTEIKVEFAEAKIKNLPKSVKLTSAEETYQFNAKVQYTGLNQFTPVYDSTVTYRSSDPLIEVDENGLVSVAGEIPEGGCVAYVTAYAGSSNEKVSAVCKVVVGDYQGERIVGSLTISARPIVKAQLISHAMITYTAYEDTEFNVSYYDYYKPNEKYIALMQDYADHPEKYSSDPALYSDNELGIEDRDSYFDISHAGAYSEPQPVQLAAGNSVTISDYGVENTPLYFILTALENSTLSTFSPQAQELVQCIKQYMAGEEFDAAAAFDDLISTLVQIYGYTNMLGASPADGVGDGGMMVNREAYNQFRRADLQTPNHYYTVDITADELAMLKGYLADPQNNYYSLMVNSCASSTVNIWNTTLADRPELRLKGNYTGLAAEPMSVYYEIWFLKYKSDIDGIGGDDFYPRIVVPEPSKDPDPEEPTEPEDPDEKEDTDDPYPVDLGKWYMLGDADGDGEVTILDATSIQRYLADLIGGDYIDLAASCITDDEVNILDATQIRRCLASFDTPYSIGERFNRATGSPVETVDQTVIADMNGVKVTVNGFGRGYLPYLDLTIENSSDKDVILSIEPVTVNGFQTSADFSIITEDGEESADQIRISAGDTVQYPFVFDGSVMLEDFMEFVAQISMVTSLIDPDEYTLINSSKTVINTSAYGVFDYSYDENGDTVYDNNDIKIIFKGLSDDGSRTPVFYINNQSDKDIIVSVKDSEVNGSEIESSIGAGVSGGCRALSSLIFWDETNQGDKAEITFEICAYDETAGDMTVLYTADAFSFAV